MILFVYGTLQRGERNHRLLNTCDYIGEGQTDAAYDFVTFDDYPAMISGGCTAIVGEVYAVDEATLAALDALEEHPEYYQRTPIRLADGRDVHCYLLPRTLADGAPTLTSGDWRHRPPSRRPPA